MSDENVRERKKKKKFTLIVVPEAEQPRTFSLSKGTFLAALLAAFFGIVVLVALLLLYTPARSLLPVTNSEIEALYGKQISAIQEQVVNLSLEMTRLRSYNLQLRRALGEEMSPAESSAIAAAPEELPEQASPMPQRFVQDTASPQEEHAQGAPSVFADALPGREPLRQADDEAMFPFSPPVDGYVSRGFDRDNYHYGIDFVGRVSSPISAAADGNVIFAGWTYEDGLTMIVAHPLGYLTVYKHNEALLKNAGASVKRGEIIALLGNTGKTSSGPHLHFEIWKDGVPYDPANYLLMTQ
jgi:murein DD-endopeptidase MepM/ murein hydrolase activator NlpD